MGAGPQRKADGHQDLEFGSAGADGVALQQAHAVHDRVAQLTGGAEGGGADPAEALITGFGGVGVEDAVVSVHAIADFRFAAIEELISARADGVAVGTGAAPDQVAAFTALEGVGAG